MVTFCNNFQIYKNDTVSLACNLGKYQFFEIDLHTYGVHYNATRLNPNFLRDTGSPIESDNNAILLKRTIDESIINFYKTRDRRRR